jgi:hypothetical protein
MGEKSNVNARKERRARGKGRADLFSVTIADSLSLRPSSFHSNRHLLPPTEEGAITCFLPEQGMPTWYGVPFVESNEAPIVKSEID